MEKGVQLGFVKTFQLSSYLKLAISRPIKTIIRLMNIFVNYIMCFIDDELSCEKLA